MTEVGPPDEDGVYAYLQGGLIIALQDPLLLEHGSPKAMPSDRREQNPNDDKA